MVTNGVDRFSYIVLTLNPFKMFKKTSLLLLIPAALMMSCSSPSGKITDDSKTPECEENLLNALYTFSIELGVPMNIAPEDGKTIMDKGEIQKEYGLAGYRYTVYFGLEAGSDGCKLVYYKQKKKGPGESSTSWGDYGSVALDQCKCE